MARNKAKVDRPLIDRLRERFKENPIGCWEWVGTKNSDGYGMFSFRKNGRITSNGAYKLVYEALVGIVPKGKQLDHLCRNRSCVNPSHLEPVTARENMIRGVNPCAKNARKTHCKRGHEFTKENTRITTDEVGRKGRLCRVCIRENGRIYMRALRAKKQK